jgi:hypothetical protein
MRVATDSQEVWIGPVSATFSFNHAAEKELIRYPPRELRGLGLSYLQ